MKLLQSANMLAGPASFKVPAGQYAALELRAVGVNAGGATMTLAQLGRITITWRGVAVTNVNFADLNGLNNLIGGVAVFASAIGAAFNAFGVFHASYSGDGNVFDVTEDDDLYVSVDLSGITAAIIASGTISLFGTMADGVQKYFPRLFYIQANVPAAGTYPYTLQTDNVTHIYIAPLTNLARLQITADRQIRFFGSTAELLDFTNYNSRVEVAVAAQLLLPLAVSGELTEALSDDIGIQIEAGAGGACTSNVLYISLDFSPDVMARSAATVQNKNAVVMSRKANLGKGRATKVVAAVASRS